MTRARLQRLTLAAAGAALTALAVSAACAQTAPAPGPAGEGPAATPPAAATLPVASAATLPAVEAAPPTVAAESPGPGAFAGTSSVRPSGGVMPASYDLLTRKSIFSRDRTPRRERPVGPAFTTPVVRERPLPVLIGILREDDGFVAFLEEPDTGRLSHFRTGDRLPGTAGIVEAISLTGLDIAGAAGQQPAHIGVGQNLAGAIPPPPVETTAASSSAAAPAATSSGAAADATAGPATTGPASSGPEDVVERLKRLRRESMNK